MTSDVRIRITQGISIIADTKFVKLHARIQIVCI
jgi:hypothetical protein